MSGEFFDLQSELCGANKLAEIATNSAFVATFVSGVVARKTRKKKTC